MARFVFFLFLVGAAVYLLTPPGKAPEVVPEVVSTAQTLADHEVSGPLRSSWASSLQTLRKEPEAAEANDQQPLYPENSGSLPRQETDEKEAQPTPGSQPLLRVEQASAPTMEEQEEEAVKWVRLTEAVRTRSRASISSPLLRSYSAGSKVQVVGRSNGWVQLLDPTTQERGWVYHAYLASIDAPSAAQLAAASEPKPVKAASPKSRKPIARKPARTTKPAVRTTDTVKVTKAKQWRDRKVRRAERRHGLGLFKRRNAQRAWSLGPAR
jgi:hypothetical protein